MRFLLDTNVLSELVKPEPNQAVHGWLEASYEPDLFISVLSFAEIRKGIEKLPLGSRRSVLLKWMEALGERFASRIVEVDRRIAEQWGIIVVRAQKSGSVIPDIDALFAATAEVHGLVLATRNVRNFRGAGVPLFNPWTGALS